MRESLLNLEDDKFGLKALFHILIGFVIFMVTNLTASIIVDLLFMFTKFAGVFNVLLRCLLEIGLFCIGLRLYVYKVLKLNFSYFRIPKLGFSLFWTAIAIFLPLTVILYFFVFTRGTISYGNGDSIFLNVAFALKIGLSAGICEEILFRGFTMKLVENRWNKPVAILIPSVLFASLHLLKGMGSIDVVLLLIAGITVGIMFSLVTYQSKNVWNAVIIHSIWNTLILGVFRISGSGGFKSLVNYVVENDNVMITGGRFGIEASLPAIVGYMIIIAITFILSRNSQKSSVHGLAD